MISSFYGEYRFLSNFWPAEVTLDGQTYPSVEHAYVAAKTDQEDDRQLIRRTINPGAVKRIGRKLKLRDGWDDIKLPVMEDLVWLKFQHPDLRARLLSTGNQQLVEGNTWGDKFWGVCDGEGENHLGKILMSVRSHCRISFEDILG